MNRPGKGIRAYRQWVPRAVSARGPERRLRVCSFSAHSQMPCAAGIPPKLRPTSAGLCLSCVTLSGGGAHSGCLGPRTTLDKSLSWPGLSFPMGQVQVVIRTLWTGYGGLLDMPG